MPFVRLLVSGRNSASLEFRMGAAGRVKSLDRFALRWANGPTRHGGAATSTGRGFGDPLCAYGNSLRRFPQPLTLAWGRGCGFL